MSTLANRDDIEQRLLRALAKVNSQAARQVRDALGNPPDVANIPAELWDTIEANLRGALIPELESVYVQAAEAAGGEIGIGFAFDVVNENAARWAQQYGYDLVRGINDNSRRMLQQSIGQFFDAPMTNAQLQDKLGRVFGPQRAMTIARTEVTRAAVEGDRAVVAQIREAGVEMRARWLTANDDVTCPICGPRNGQLQGEGWQDFPPAHPRCRCGIAWEVVTPETS